MCIIWKTQTLPLRQDYFFILVNKKNKKAKNNNWRKINRETNRNDKIPSCVSFFFVKSEKIYSELISTTVIIMIKK